MVWDTRARLLGVKTIGTVESNLNYTSVYYTDAITVGMMQNYGPKAAAILTRMRLENASSWVGVSQSLINDLDSYDGSFDGNTNYSYWSSRYLTGEEGESIKPVLNNNRAIQNDDALKIIDAYATVADRIGMDKNGNTEAVLFFFTMYHQSPKRALNVVASNGPNSTIERLRNAALNEIVLGRYRSRYNRAYDLIKANDISGVEDLPTNVTPWNGADEELSAGVNRIMGPISYAQAVSGNILVKLDDGSNIWLYQQGGDYYTPSQSNNIGANPVPLPPNTNPIIPPDTTANSKRIEIVNWLKSKYGVYRYSQGVQRLQPDVSGYTDCSALLWYGYKQLFNIDIGTYSGDQRNKGVRVWSGIGSQVQSNKHLFMAGDILCRNGHVEMYLGEDRIGGHGGPGNGPTEKSINVLSGWTNVWVQRHL